MTDAFATLDLRDVFYAAIGLALLGLTIQPALARFRLLNVPLVYIGFGAALAALGLPAIDPRASGIEGRVIEHVSELIVIISLAGAGLAIDTPMTWRNWQAAFRLLLVAMPVTIAAVAVAGVHWLGLSLGGAMLLAAALAPTDPVLARTVEVSPPGRDETPMSVALTAEAGMNDGLAFPFVYLAIAIATYGWTSGVPDWFGSWLWFDLAYRLAAGWLGGLAVGWVVSRIAFSGIGDAGNGAWNSVVMVLAATLLAYGLVEAIDGYGFLAVFAAARAGRARTRGTDAAPYQKFVHHGADQLESILLALLLLWFGTFVGSGGLSGLTWSEMGFALALVFVIRPAAGLLSLIRYPCPQLEAGKVAFFGVRGMGSIFYLAYAQNHAEFADIDTVWRIAAIVIVTSIVVHGFGANFAIGTGEPEGDVEMHPYAEYERRRDAAE